MGEQISKQYWSSFPSRERSHDHWFHLRFYHSPPWPLVAFSVSTFSIRRTIVPLLPGDSDEENNSSSYVGSAVADTRPWCYKWAPQRSHGKHNESKADDFTFWKNKTSGLFLLCLINGQNSNSKIWLSKRKNASGNILKSHIGIDFVDNVTYIDIFCFIKSGVCSCLHSLFPKTQTCDQVQCAVLLSESWLCSTRGAG